MYGIPTPPSVAWLQTAPFDEVTYDLFLQVCRDYAQYQLACGVSADRIMNPEQFVKPGDLQTLANVVSWWPKSAPATIPAPTLPRLLPAMVRTEHGNDVTFVEMLNLMRARLGPWMAANKVNPNDPNESREEREKRLNRERVARHRVRHAEEPEDDPELAALVRDAKLQSEYVTQGRKWLRDVERHAKHTYDAAVAQAKLARTATVSDAEAQLAAQIQRAEDAKALVDAYKARK